MDCAAVKPKMEALVSGSLPASERTLAEQHIAMCEGCRLELELVRAIGSQEKPPSSAGSKDDWTLDRIFGAEGGPVPTSAAPPAPVESSPEESLFGSAGASAADAFASPEIGATSDASETSFASSSSSPPDAESSESDRGPIPRKPVEATWSFEPIDAKSQAPPEQSLFFAAEALNRTRETASRKGSKARMLIWGLGGLVGVGLLAFSTWFVLHMESPSETPVVRPAPSPAQGAPETAPSPPPEEVTPDNAQPPDGTIQDDGGEPPNNTVQTAPAPAPQATSATTAPQPMPLAARPAPKPSATSTKAATKPVVTTPAPKPAVTTPAPTPVTSKPAPTVTVVRHPAPAVQESTPVDDSDVTDDSDDETVTPAPPTVKAPEPLTRMPGSAMWSSRMPRAAEPPPPVADTQSTEISTPIQRLHLATVAAVERGNVGELRRMRATWKSFMAKTVGPDRFRAKREYADCIWAIQDLTGRRADQKDALAAYRDYLLGAPAGGADSRSVGRLRLLEDALAEPH